MINISVMSPIRKVYDQNKDLFAQRGLNYNSATSFLSMPVLGCETLSDLVRHCPWSYSVSTLSRSVKKFEPNRFMRRMQKRILKRYKDCDNLDPADFCFAIDDTANPKYGDGIFRRYPFHSSSGPYHGQKVLVVVLVDMKRGFAIPLAYAFLTSTKEPDHIKAPDVALGLLKDLLAAGFPKLPVVTDSWFDSVDFIRELKTLGLDFAGEIKSTRLVRANPGPHVAWVHLQEFFADEERERLPLSKSQKRRRKKRGKALSKRILYVNNLGRPVMGIAVYNRFNGATAFAFYATTDLSMSGAKLWQYSRARWCIECLFRDLKQNLSFGCLPCEGEPGADLSVCLPLMLITSMRLDGIATWNSDHTTIGKILAQHREKALSDSIDLIVHNPKHGKVSRLQARRSNPRSKPTNLCGEKKVA